MQKFPRNALFTATLLACSSIAFADDAPAPAPAAAAAAPAAPTGPTLSDILTNSGIELKGYVDVSAEGSDLATKGNPYKVFDVEHSNLGLHQVGVTIDKLPKEGFGGLLNVTIGKDADVIRSYGAGSTGYFDATQAFIQYAGGPLTVQAGKFVTLAGAEVIDSSANTNVSRSILFGIIPFTHTGLRATYALNDTTNLIAGVNNGWDEVSDPNTQKTVELGLTANPVKPLTIAASIYTGVEPVGGPGAYVSGSNTAQGQRTLFDLVLSYAVTDSLTLVLNGDYATQENAPLVAGGTGDASWYGLAGYVNYQIDEADRISLRVEDFKDENAYTKGYLGPDAAKSHEVNEFTFTYGYAAAKNFELRTELRFDSSDKQDMIKPDGSFTKSGTTFMLAGLLKF